MLRRLIALLVVVAPALAGAAPTCSVGMSSGGAAEFPIQVGVAQAERRTSIVLSVTCPAGLRWSLSMAEQTALAGAGAVEVYSDQAARSQLGPGSAIAGTGTGAAQLVPVFLLFKPAAGRAIAPGRYMGQLPITLSY